VRAAVHKISGWLLAFDQFEGKARDNAARALSDYAGLLRYGLGKAMTALREVVDQGADVESGVRDRVLVIVEEFERVLDERGVARIAASDQEYGRSWFRRSLTGRAAARSLGNEYDQHANKEVYTANVLRRWVAGLAVLVAGAAAWFNYAVTEATLLLELARLSVTIPLGLLALYLARESARHRAAAGWSRELAIALHSVDSYIATSPKADGEALRQALGMRIFGATPDTPAADPSESDLLHTVLTKLTETVSMEVLGRLGLGGHGQKSSGSGESKPGDTKI
jgi:hypothetical protein